MGVGLKVRLANLKMDDLSPFGLKGLSASQYGIGSLSSQVINPTGE